MSRSRPSAPFSVPALSALGLSSAAVLPPAAAAAPADPDRGAAEYTLTLLDPTDGVMSSAQGISESGEVIGLQRPTKKAQPQETVLWRAGEATGEALGQYQGTSQFSRPFDISDARTAVGEAFDDAGSSVPVLWADGAAPVRAHDSSGFAVDIANSGTIVVQTAEGAFRGRPDALEPLPAPAAEEPGSEVTRVRVTALAEDGSAVGTATIEEAHGDHSHGVRRAVVWDGDTPTLLEEPAEHVSADPAGIAGADVVVGSARIDRVETAYVWREGRAEALATTPVAEYPHTKAAAVNTQGQAVGYASRYAGNTSFGGSALLWDGGGVTALDSVVDLPEGVTLREARDINEAGQIVGTAETPDGARGYVLTPTAGEPTGEPTPTEEPSAEPTPAPSEEPSEGSSDGPTGEPTAPEPTDRPSGDPTEAPDSTPSVSPSPDAQPTHTDSPTAPGGRDDDSTDDSASGSGRGDSPGSLPRTGTQVLGLLGIGAVLVAVGAVAVLRVRRRG